MVTRASFLASVLTAELVARVARALAAEGIEVMPLKGALLQRWVYPDPAEREVSDVDVLVQPGAFRRAEAALQRAGFRWLRSEGSDWQSVWLHPEVPIEIDLHRRLARTRRHRLTPEALFEAGHRDATLFGVPVVLPSPADLYAHLVAHASATLLLDGVLHRPRDLSATAERLGLGARPLAAHLARRGVGRHARLVLPLVRDDPFAAQVLHRLPADPLGAVVARAARRAVERAPSGSPRRRIPGVLLNPTLAEAGRAVAEGAWQRARAARRAGWFAGR